MIFRDRTDAGRRLAELIKPMRLERPVVLGIPRGGVPVAAEVARALGAELGVIVARKLGAPGEPELAIGAITAEGACYLDEETVAMSGASDAYIAAEKERQQREAARREALFDSHRRPALRGRNVVVVDDGVATGSTVIAALRAVKAAGAARVIVAVPVGPPRTIERLRQEADDVVCLRVEPRFFAVGQFYEQFEQVPDEEIVRILRSFAPVAVDPSRDFTVFRGEGRLRGRFTTPAGNGPFPAVIFVHGLGSSKESPRNVVIAEALVDCGIASVLFDLSGHGESTGSPDDGLSAYVDDLRAVYAWTELQPEVDPARLGIAGSSLGAVVAIEAVIKRKVRPAAMVLRAPPARPEQFAQLDVPSLLLIGSEDPLLAEATAGARRSGCVELSIVEGAGHLFEEPGALEEARKRTVAWFERFLLPQAGLPGLGRVRQPAGEEI
ncbi:MAG TPA: alpha/beta fold hydrolase [Dehalococcoidia bacterium]|nr:alpha/beta fold hydrolase [Dehalococcoidia bacterium]